jgi:RNA polymerase sigma factor (TIGR02999 family)
MLPPRDDITALLRAAGDGQDGAMERLVTLVYDELQRLARHQRHVWGGVRAPGTRSLVHEAFVKLAGQDIDWQSRGQFFFIASRAMRSILVDNARHFARQKREGARQQVPLSDDLLVSEARGDDLLELDRALSRLEAADPQLARTVECRIFGGLTIEETADALGVSPATIKRSWNLARAWLHQEMTTGDGDGSRPPQDT